MDIVRLPRHATKIVGSAVRVAESSDPWILLSSLHFGGSIFFPMVIHELSLVHELQFNVDDHRTAS